MRTGAGLTGQYARLMTSIHATPKVSILFNAVRWIHTDSRQTLPAPFRDSASTSSSSTNTKPPPHPLPSSAPAARAAAPAPTAHAATARPAPLQAHAKQEQSPVISEGNGKMLDPDTVKPLKPPMTSHAPAPATKPVKTAASKPKRGLKRL